MHSYLGTDGVWQCVIRCNTHKYLGYGDSRQEAIKMAKEAMSNGEKKG